MTQHTSLHARHAAAQAKVTTATGTVEARHREIERAEAEIARHTPTLEADPKNAEADSARAKATGDLHRAKFQATQAQNDLQVAKRELAEVERLIGGDDALKRAKEHWLIVSAAQVQATKAAQAAREKLAKLDTLLREEESKTDTAKEAQRAAILASHGFGDEPAAEVSAVQDVLLGAAATVDALRAGRPTIEAKVAEAEKALIARDRETRAAVQAILAARQAIAECVAQQALAECRAAAQAYHAATLAATGQFGERLALYDPHAHGGDDAAIAMDAEVKRLQARAFVGE